MLLKPKVTPNAGGDDGIRIVKGVDALTSVDQYSDLLNVINYVPELKGFLLKGGYLGCTFICQPLTGVNEDIRNSLDNLYQKTFPKNSFLQMQLVSSQYLQDDLDRFGSIRESRAPGELGDLYDEISRATHEYLQRSAQQPLSRHGSLKLRDFEIWVSFKMPIKKEGKPREKEIEEFSFMLRKLQSTLELIHMSPVAMDRQTYLHRLQMLHNHTPNASWRRGYGGQKASLSIAEQVLEQGTSVQVHTDGIEVVNAGEPISHSANDGKLHNGTYIKMLSLLKPPEVITFGDIYELVCDWRTGQDGIREPFILTLNIFWPEQKKVKADFIKMRTWVSHQSKSPIAQIVERLAYQKRDCDEFNRSLEDHDAQIAKTSLSITLFAESKSQADKVSFDVQTFASRKKWQLKEEKFIALPMFLSCLPMGVDEACIALFHRFKLITSDRIKFLTPVIASWKGNGRQRAVVPLVTRDGQLFWFDLFTSNGNYNIFVAAASGSGKSFFVNYLLTHLQASGIKTGGNIFRQGGAKDKFLDGGRAFIIDVGRSYEKLCERYNGNFVEFGDNFRYSLNPFLYIHEFSGKDGQGDMVLSLLQYMASPQGVLTDFQVSTLTTILSEVWEEKRQKALIDDVAAACKAHDDTRVQDLGFQLDPWCKGGVYGEFFTDEYPPIDFSGNMVVIELEELKSRKVLQIAVLLQVISSIQHEMFLSGLDQYKLFVLDEAWEFLKVKGGAAIAIAQFLEAGWRRFRKYNAAGVCITQSVSDAYETETGRAMADNSQFKALLRQEPEVVKKIREAGQFDGSETEFELLKSVHTLKGVYSEVFIRATGASEVVRLYTSRYQQLVFSTDGRDNNAIKHFMQQGFSNADAIQMVVDQEEAAHTQHLEDNKEGEFTPEFLEKLLSDV